MTDFLKLNHFPITCADASSSTAYESIGRTERTVDAGMRTNRRAIKRQWKFKTTPQSARTSFAIADLVLGRGNYWSFDVHMYSAKGLGPSSYSGSTTVQYVQYKYGAGSLSVPSTHTFVVAGAYTDGGAVSVACWVRVSGVWTHYAVIRTAAGVAQNYVNGSASGATLPFTFSSGTFTITGTATEVYYDDLIVMPSLWPTTWPALIYGASTAFSPLGRLNASGASIGDNAATVSVVGAVDGLEAVQAYDSSTWSQNMQEVAFTLHEA